MLELMCGSSTDDRFWIPSIPPSQFLLQCNVTCHKLCRPYNVWPYICNVTAKNNLLVSLIIQKQSINLCMSVIVHTHTHCVTYPDSWGCCRWWGSTVWFWRRLLGVQEVSDLYKTWLETNGAAVNWRLLLPLEQKNENQSDHSNACYTAVLLSTANLIHQFRLRFPHLWNKQPEINCNKCDGWSHGNHMTAWLPTLVGWGLGGGTTTELILTCFETMDWNTSRPCSGQAARGHTHPLPSHTHTHTQH